MRPLRLPLTIAALLVASLFAGCLGAGGETMTARDGLDDARSAAEAWADGEDLELIGAVAVEPFKRIQYESDDGEHEAEYVTHLDGNPGDGRAPGWAYGFYTGERCVSIVLAAGLGVLAEGFETCDGDLDTMPDWSVDSDEAAEILGGEEDWPDLGEDGTYFWGLSNEDGTPLWMVGASGEDGETVFATLDASTGEVLEIVHDAAGEYDGLIGESAEAQPVDVDGGMDEDSDSASVLLAGDQLVAEVELGAMGFLRLEVNANGVVLPLEVTVEGPYGIVEETEFGGTAVGLLAQGRNYDGLPAGHYTVTVEAQGTAALPNLYVHGEW
jgi:hypothetical protein